MSDFTDEYKNKARFVDIMDAIKQIPSQAIYQWPLLVTATISNSVVFIGA